MKPARPCLHPGCSRLSTSGPRCPEHQRLHDRQHEQQRGTPTKRGYGYRWAQLSRLVLERDGYVCQVEPGCQRPATTVDHIVAKRRGGTDEPSNLRAACREHNSAKGAR